MSKYTKDDVQTHSEGYSSRQYPAVNVKVYNFPVAWKAADRFKCSEEQAEKALNFAFDSACARFWDDVQSFADESFEYKTVVRSAGRSNGWAIVQGLENIESWNAIDLAKWHKFENMCKRAVEFYTSEEQIYSDIKANRWMETGAELYNFVEFENKKTACIVDIKAVEADARKAYIENL